jgi:hypothetical protein
MAEHASLLVDPARERKLNGMGHIIRRMTRVAPRGDLVLADCDERAFDRASGLPGRPIILKDSRMPPATDLLRRLFNRDRGESRDSSPPTPPYIRVRIRRFNGLDTVGVSRCAGESDSGVRRNGFGPFERRIRASPFLIAAKAVTWIFGRMARLS